MLEGAEVAPAPDFAIDMSASERKDVPAGAQSGPRRHNSSGASSSASPNELIKPLTSEEFSMSAMATRSAPEYASAQPSPLDLSNNLQFRPLGAPSASPLLLDPSAEAFLMGSPQSPLSGMARHLDATRAQPQQESFWLPDAEAAGQPPPPPREQRKRARPEGGHDSPKRRYHTLHTAHVQGSMPPFAMQAWQHAHASAPPFAYSAAPPLVPPSPQLPSTHALPDMPALPHSMQASSSSSSSSSSATSSPQAPAARRLWAPEEDAALQAAVARHGEQNWKALALEVPGRSHVQCLQRWRKALRPGLKKGPWDALEDAALLAQLSDAQQRGQDAVRWPDVAAHVPGRTAKQCRERWGLNLDPSISKAPWSRAEDALLLQLHARLGSRWAQISSAMPGRTENAAKSRFKSIQRAISSSSRK